MSKYVSIDTVAVNKAMTELGLKRWWVAEQIGKATSTFRRWLSGEIRVMEWKDAAILYALLGLDGTELKPVDRRVSLGRRHEKSQKPSPEGVSARVSLNRPRSPKPLLQPQKPDASSQPIAPAV